ncbi:MAG: hypothetical protein CL678_17320 [Bdellovibrionaceae bacterium]|nr:hypothetical protein [Pseudobdellovibrionaceae bacterium]|tara:strand:- start:1503 stop:2144 length:642 start_codon:yes stop_codon:yes gene_type:complete
MNRKPIEEQIEGIAHLLSHLTGEVNALEKSYSGVLRVLHKLEASLDYDDLTGLLRRNSFFRKYEKLMEECRTLGESLGVLMIDIDYFKVLNDQHGHPTGDEVIRKVAELLKQFESPNCMSGRYGGEEFVVAMRGTDAEMLGVAEFIRRGAERLHGPVMDSQGKPQANVEWKCTLSVGVASSNKEGFDATRLIKVADEALYQAKKSGRNCVKAA